MTWKENYSAYNKWLEVVSCYNYQPTKHTPLYNSEHEKFMKFCESKHYAAIIFLALEQGHVCYGDVRNIALTDWTHYFNTLSENGIIEKIRTNKELKSQYMTLSGYGKYQIEQIKFYKLSEKALQFFNYPPTYEFVKKYCVPTVRIQMVLNRKKEDYERNLAYRDAKQQQERMKGILAMRKAGVELPAEDKKFYEQLLGRTVR